MAVTLTAPPPLVAEKSANVLAVRNELHVGALTTFANQNYDRSLTAKVTIALIEAPGVPSGTISVVAISSDRAGCVVLKLTWMALR